LSARLVFGARGDLLRSSPAGTNPCLPAIYITRFHSPRFASFRQPLRLFTRLKSAFVGHVGNYDVQIETIIQPVSRDAMIAVGTRIMETRVRT